MIEGLNDTVEESNKTSKQKEIEEAKRQYNNNKKNAEHYSKLLKESKAKLVELGVDIEEK